MNKNDLWEVPVSWKWVHIIELGEVVSGGTPSTKESSYWGNEINWITPADLSGYTKKFISKGSKSLSQKGLENSSAKLMPSGSIHFSSRAPIGYVAISQEELSTNQGFKNLVPSNEVFNEYIYYFLKNAKQLAEDRASGTTFKELSGKAFSELPIPVAPKNEQHRIATKIEELFSDLDDGIASLKKAQAQLKIYRQAVLKYAFEGKLTAEWRKARAETQRRREKSHQEENLCVSASLRAETQTLLKQIKQEREHHYTQQLEAWQQTVEAWETNGKPGKKPAKPKQPKELPPLTDEELAELPELPEGWEWVKVDKICEHDGYAIKAGPFGSALKK